MIVNYWLLSIALLLLWLPRQWLRFGTQFIRKPKPRPRPRDRVLRNPRNPGDISLRFREEVAKPRNWLDLVRAVVAALVIEHACFEQAAGAGRGVAIQIFLIQAAIYVVAVLIQTIRLEGRLTLAAPVFFVSGLSVALMGWMPTLFACIAIWVVNIMLPGAASFLFVFSGLQMIFGVFLARLPLRDAGLAAGLTMLPVLFSLTTKRRLIQLSRKTKPGAKKS